jgi:tetratricopeptide (TPR) repeat protein
LRFVSPSDFVQRGLHLLERGEYQEAVKTCRLGLLGRPGAIEGRVVLGRALLALGRYDEVLAEMQVALDALPSYALAHMLRGEALYGKGDLFSARASLRLAAVLAPDDPEIAGKVRLAEAAPARPARPQAPRAAPAASEGTETKHYRRAAGSEPSVLEEDTASDDNPTSVLYGETSGEPGGAPWERDEATSLREQKKRTLTFGEEASTTVHVAEELRQLEPSFGDDVETVMRAPLRALGTPAYGEAQPGRPLFPAHDDSAERRGPAEETLLTLPLSPQLVPGHSIANGRTPNVAKKKNTEPLGDDALVEVPPPPGHGRSQQMGAPPGFGAAGASGGSGGGKPPRLPNAPSQPPPRRNPAGQSQPPPRPAPQVARPSKSISVPPPIPSAPPAQPPGGNWQQQPVPAVGAQARTVLAGPPVRAPMGPPPGSQPLPRPMPPPPSSPDGPLGAQRAGAFQAYQTAIAAQPPQQPYPVAPPPVPPQSLPARAPAPPAASMSMSDSVPVMAAPAPAKSAKPRTKSKKKGRTGLATALWVLVGAAVIGGGVFAGFQIRDLRLRRQIDAAEKRATESSASDTWQGWRTARDGLASIAAARRTPESRAALARAQAILAYELGEGAQLASATLRPLGADSRTAAARAYMALIAGDAAAASREVGMIADGNAANADYLRGRVALLSGDAKAAIAALEKSHRAEPRPFTAVALAEAYVAADRWDDARTALDAALAKSAEHPALTIAKASLADRLGKHTPATSAEDIARLERIAADGAKPVTAQSRASRWQAAMALLTEAGLQLRRGERDAALNSIARALDLGVDEQRLAEASVVSLLGADLPEVATAGAKRGLAAWPQSMVLRTTLAQGAFAEGRMNEVIEALPDALIGKDPLALTVRARARLAAGDLEAARRDLDSAAAATSPELLVARSLLKLASGESLPDAAKVPATRPDLALVAATAARLRGEPAAAVAMLEPLVRGPLGAERYTIRLELARAYRDVANYPGARAAYAELSALKNPTVRLEAAQLLLEDRDPKGAREHIEALLRDVGDKATGLTLVEAMRIRTLTGAAASAESLADRAFKAGAPPWMLHRETARIARRRDVFPAAVEALNKALDGSKADIDTLLLACDLVDGAPEAFVAKVTKAVDERLAGTPDQLVAQAKLAIARGERDQAIELFGKATQKFMEKPASARRVAQASFGVGALAVVRGDWVQAKLKLETALELDPSLIDAYLYHAEALASSGALKQAISRLKVASEYNPESAIVWQLLERRATEANDKKTASDAAARAAELQAKKPS